MDLQPVLVAADLRPVHPRAAQPLRLLEHDDRVAGGQRVAGGRQTGRAGADDGDAFGHNAARLVDKRQISDERNYKLLQVLIITFDNVIETRTRRLLLLTFQAPTVDDESTCI